MLNKKWSREAYDKYYARIDMLRRPFGYNWDYVLWRNEKVKGDIIRFIEKDGLLLDVGGGFGLLVRFLPSFFNVNTNYINLDPSNVMLRHCPYENVCATGEFIPFKENTFDYLICSGVLEYVKDKQMVLRECYRVLRHEGLLLLTTPRTGWEEDFRKSPFVVFYYSYYVFESFTGRRRRHSISSHALDGLIYEPSDERWLRATLEELGFRVLRQWRVDNHVPWARNGQSKFWRWFSDHFVDPRKFGQSTCLVCIKISHQHA